MASVIRDDGDVIKGLGYLALYGAYLEEAIDGVLEALLSCGVPHENGIERAMTSRKIKFCRSGISGLVEKNEEMAALDAGLDHASRLFDRRNDLIHGRFYAQYGGKDIRKSGRKNVPDREVVSGELYSLANELFDARDPLLKGSMFSIWRAFNTSPPKAITHA